MKKSLFLALGLTGTLLMANPAKRQTLTLQQPDGTEIQVLFDGDEFGAIYRSAATGERLMQDANSGEWVVMNESDLKCDEQLRASRRSAMAPAQTMMSCQVPSEGEIHLPCLLVNFSDLKFSDLYTTGGYDSLTGLYEDLFNGEDYKFQGATGSMSQYFYDQSYHKFKVHFDIIGPVTLSKKFSVYGASNSATAAGIAEALDSAYVQGLFTNEQTFGWDNNNDAQVDCIYVMFAGYQESQNGITSYMWPHKSNISPRRYDDGLPFYTYVCSAELKGKPGDDLEHEGIGTQVHEFSHALGLPDFYDTNKTKGDNACYGMDYWSTMDEGCYNNKSRTPTAFTAFERLSLGWMEVDSLPLCDDSITVSLSPIDATPSAFVYYNPNNSNEYFLFENHQRQGWDKYLASSTMSYIHGMLITHVDYNENLWNNNNVNSVSTHQHYTIVPADGTLLAYNYAAWNTQDQNVYYTWRSSFFSDIWPSEAGSHYLTGGLPIAGPFTTFDKDSQSPAVFYDGTEAQFVIENIAEVNGNITFSIKPQGYVASQPDGISGIEDGQSPKPHILLRDGRIYLQRGNGCFDLEGRSVIGLVNSEQ